LHNLSELSAHTRQLSALGRLVHARAVVDALLGRLARPESEKPNSAVTKEGLLAAKSDSLRPSAQGNLRLGTLESEPKALAIEILAKLIARAAADNHAQEEKS